MTRMLIQLKHRGWNIQGKEKVFGEQGVLHLKILAYTALITKAVWRQVSTLLLYMPWRIIYVVPVRGHPSDTVHRYFLWHLPYAAQTEEESSFRCLRTMALHSESHQQSQSGSGGRLRALLNTPDHLAGWEELIGTIYLWGYSTDTSSWNIPWAEPNPRNCWPWIISGWSYRGGIDR